MPSSPNRSHVNRKPPEPTAWLLWTAERGGQYVMHGCERAEVAGVRAGMTLAHARSLLVNTSVVESPCSPAEDARALRGLARWMLRFAPVVAPDDPDGLLCDIAGCEALFGGERRHVERVAHVLGAWGLSARLAVAPTFGCARAVARYGKTMITFVPPDGIHAVLAPLPVRALRIDGDALDALADVGIECIGHLFDIPRDELAARFGPALLARLDQATGAVAETIRPIQAAPRFEASRNFEGPIRRWEIIVAATRELLVELLSKLRSLDRGVLSLAVELRRADLAPKSLALRLSHPSRDDRHLWGLLQPRLERVHLGFGVEGITLRAMRTAPVRSEQTVFLRDVADAAEGTSALGELVDRLLDRLGPNAVARAQPAETYVPEKAFGSATVCTLAPSRTSRVRPDKPRLYPAHRPAQLFDVPEPVRVMSLVPDGPPAWIEWRGLRATVRSSVGPERIAFPWWTGRTSPVRDYYEVDDERGRRLWVYRDIASGNWFVHGQWT